MENMAEKLRQLREAAVFALENADYKTAHAKLLAAQAIYDTTPNQQKDGLNVEYRSIESLMRRIEAKIRGGRPTRIPVEVTRPEEELSWR